jgi:hypothetical protein
VIKYFNCLLPIYIKSIRVNKSVDAIKSIIEQELSKEDSPIFPYQGRLKGNIFKFSKRTYAKNNASELVYIAKIKEEEHGFTCINIFGRFGIIPMIPYAMFLYLFTAMVWPVDGLYKASVALLPYLFMILKIKLRSKSILEYFEYTLQE